MKALVGDVFSTLKIQFGLAYVKGQCHREDFGMKNTKDKVAATTTALHFIINKSRSYVKILLHLLCLLLCFSVFNKPKINFEYSLCPSYRFPESSDKKCREKVPFKDAVCKILNPCPQL
jgi:hypothetical protein